MITEAEDVVQDTYEKWLNVDVSNVKNNKAYLVKAVTNRSINQLNKLKRSRQFYIGPWLPEPYIQTINNEAEHKLEMFHPLSMGIMVMLEKLSPQERAVFLLKEIFSYDYDEIADIVNKTNDNCRQIFKRALQHLKEDKKRFEVNMHMYEKIFSQFMHACYNGDVEGLIELLREDIVMVTDGGGSAFKANGKTLQALKKPVVGKEAVAKFIIAIVQFVQNNVPGFKAKTVLVNDMPSLACYSFNQPISLIILEVINDSITNIFVHSNQSKIKSLQ